MTLLIDEKWLASLNEATQLTQAGQLQQATALIQSALQGGPMHKDTEPTATTKPAFTHSASAKGELFEGDFYEVDEYSDAAFTAEAKPYAAESKPTPTSGAPFAAAGLSRLGKAWRSKLAGLTDLNTTLPTGLGSGLSSGLGAGLNSGMGASAAALPEGATFNSATFNHPAGRRDYKLYVPSGYHGQPLPLIVMLHGCTQNPDDFAAGTGMNLLAEQQPCLVLYPAQSGGANSSKCWNWFKPGDQRREEGEPAIIAGLTRQIIQDYHADAERIYVAGLSAGGAMATTLAQLYPELYAAVGVHSGLPHGVAQDLPSALAAMKSSGSPLAGLQKKGNTGTLQGEKIPAIIFHGDKDGTVHPSNGERVAAQYLPTGRVTQSKLKVQRRAGKVTNGRAYTCTIHNDDSGQPMLELWSIEGAGHAWAGGSTLGSYTDPQGPNASQEMLRFFLAHSKNAS